VALGDEQLAADIQAGTRVRVKKPVTVFHSPKLGDFSLEGQEGSVLDVRRLHLPLFSFAQSLLHACPGSCT
jgi:hypothetical protein